MATFLLFLPCIIGAILAVIICALFVNGYVKAPPDRAYIISGMRKKKKILIGKSGVKIPFFERLDRLNLALIPIDVKTTNEVPTADYINIKVDAAVNIKIGQSDEMLARASTNFLNLDAQRIASVAREVLEGNMREIMGQLSLEEMVGDRQKFALLVKENAEPDLAAMGLEIISFNVQNFEDKNGVIENLGVDNVVRIQKSAAISRAEAERDIAIKRSEANQQANDAEVSAKEQIIERNAELAKKQASLQREVDTQAAQAEAAKNIEAENQRKLREVAATNANIAKAEREAELKQKQIELKEYELDALVRKQADADKYAAQMKAEAELIQRQKNAEAAAYEVQQKAIAQKAMAEAERFVVKQQAEAQKDKADANLYSEQNKAEGIAKVGEAEALVIEKKALAQKKMSDASIIEMVLQMMPNMVANAASPLSKVDKITLYGDGNASRLVGDVMNSTNQVIEAMAANGIDLRGLISNFMKGRDKTNNN